ncbi:lipoate--protein ligase [Abyssicoccus albus]|uniref:lipoate--protein ligase n=1 Tax=Abyssicoccus albus TaxID=1817405 RepID=A0A3N5CA00_9BACL|nr:lipoate--protein ligase [Abyssicoccus albus]RPF56482.1 lipoate-protein ligase [Abyssicoccus albus]
MKFIDHKGINDAQINLAMEEYVLHNVPLDEDDYFLFYVNSPSIIIGKNQNTIEEVNQSYVDQHNITVVRRISGGGAVYHDLDNLNYSFITKDDGNSFHNFKKFTQPIVDVLNDLGVPAELSGRNDIVVNGRKVSGNAMVSVKGRMFCHGTLMLDSAIEEVVNALQVKDIKIKSKGIKSIRSRVANINEFLDEPLTIESLKEKILSYIFGGLDQVKEYELSDKDWANIRELSEEKYKTWSWNYGKSPKYNWSKDNKFEGGYLDVRLDVKKGFIEQAAIFGDFFGIGEVSELESHLVGVKHDRQALEESLKKIDTSYYLGRVTQEELLTLLV